MSGHRVRDGHNNNQGKTRWEEGAEERSLYVHMLIISPPLALRLTGKGFDVQRSNLISAAASAGKTIKNRSSAALLHGPSK